MAQGTPAYGPHDDDMATATFFNRTLGAVYWDDEPQLATIAKVAQAYKDLFMEDVSDMMEATDGQHDDALANAVEPKQVPGLKKQIYKYLGSKSARHVPPPDRTAPTGALRLCLSLRQLLPDRPLCLHVALLACGTDTHRRCTPPQARPLS